MESSKGVVKIIEGRVVKRTSFGNMIVCITKLASHGSRTKNGWGKRGVGRIGKVSYNRFGRMKIVRKERT